MDLAAALSSLIDAMKSLVPLSYELTERIKAGSYRKKLNEIVSSLPKSSYHFDKLQSAILLNKKDLTYADLCNNIYQMIHLRQSIVMQLERVLRKESAEDFEYFFALEDISHCLFSLEGLMMGFYVISQNVPLGTNKIPKDLYKMQAETAFAAKVFREEIVGAEYRNKPNPFLDKDVREKIAVFCEEMKKTVDMLCAIETSA